MSVATVGFKFGEVLAIARSAQSKRRVRTFAQAARWPSSQNTLQDGRKPCERTGFRSVIGNHQNYQAWLTRDAYVNQIQPAPASISQSSIRAVLGVSEPYAADIRAGRRRPHPRHWRVLRNLLALAPPVNERNRDVSPIDKLLQQSGVITLTDVFLESA